MTREKEIAGTPPLDMMNDMGEQGRRYILSCTIARPDVKVQKLAGNPWDPPSSV